MMRDYGRIALNNLTHRKTRSWLTLIGIFIGIASVVALISLGQGLHEAITAEFLKLGADKMEITPKNVGIPTSGSNMNDLRDRDLKIIEQSIGVLQAAGFHQKSAKVVWNNDQVGFYPVLAYTDDPVKRQMIQDFITVKIDQGRDLKTGDRAKALVGYQLTNPDNLNRPMKLGDKILVNGSTFEIVGSLQKMGDPLIDSAIYISEDAYKTAFSDQDQYDAIIVQAQPGLDMGTVADSVRQDLRHERNLKVGDEDFEVQTPEDLVKSFDAIFNIVNVVLLGIAAISLVVGGIGIMNTMYTAVLERTKEIGVMKAIGATNQTIMLIFIIESGMLGLIGGLLGLLIGWGLAKTTELIGTIVLQTTLLKAILPWWLVVGSLLFAMGTGIIAGVLPAYRASKQQAVDSLRYE